MNRQRRARRDGLSQRRRRRRGLALLVALGAAGTVGTALTASITGLPSVSADVESVAWPTFVASAVALNDPTTPTNVTFTITPTAAQARARTGGTDWSTCTATATPDQWTCPVSGGATGFEFVATP